MREVRQRANMYLAADDAESEAEVELALYGALAKLWNDFNGTPEKAEPAENAEGQESPPVSGTIETRKDQK
jgi:hypothetical protein